MFLLLATLFAVPHLSVAEFGPKVSTQAQVSHSSDAKDRFCAQDHLMGIYSTGINIKAVTRKDDTSWYGNSISKTLAFVFKRDIWRGIWDKHNVTLEFIDSNRYYDFVAFTGVDLDLNNNERRFFIELSRKVQSHQRNNPFPENQVAFSVFEWKASHLFPLPGWADPQIWNFCHVGAFISSDYCVNVATGKYVRNGLFKQSLVTLSSDNPHFALLFIKQRNRLVHISSNPNQKKLIYHYVDLSDTRGDFTKSWKRVVDEKPIDFGVVGAFELSKRYYLVISRENATMEVRTISNYNAMPLEFEEKSKTIKEFFNCGYDFSQYYITLVWVIVVAFIGSFIYICHRVNALQRQAKPMGRVKVGAHLRKATGSEKNKIPSMYLQRTDADNLYVDEGRKQRDDRRVYTSLINMAKDMAGSVGLEQLKAKVFAAKKKKKQ